MKVLVVGSGGREHALAWKARQSPRVSEVLCAPGNAGTQKIARNIPVAGQSIEAQIEGLADLAESERVGLTIVGPDDMLAAGIADRFTAKGLRIFGPTREAARLESSKIFAKEFMGRHGIPTARSGSFSSYQEAMTFLKTTPHPVVVKADGLALGKGVVVAPDLAASSQAVKEMMLESRFGAAGERVLIEEFLVGQECSIHAMIDGSHALLFPAAQDHKQAFDGDTGPNTGGMGTCSPPRLADAAFMGRVRAEVIEPFLAGLKTDGIRFQGMLFPGLMLTSDGIRVLEFNCRFGDPETQSLLPRLRTDLIDLAEAAAEGSLGSATADWNPASAVCVVMASGGYPGEYRKGVPISGIDSAESLPGVTVFHAGTAFQDGRLVTNGGRVLGVTALGDTTAIAQQRAYKAVVNIHFDNAHYRRDIGAKGI